MRPYWIQRADLSSREYPPVNLVEAEIALLGHNWQLEHALFNRLEETGGDNCPAGIGFHVGESEHVLHICPQEGGGALCFYIHDGETKTGEGINTLGQYRLLQLFFREDYKGVMRGLEGKW